MEINTVQPVLLSRGELHVSKRVFDIYGEKLLRKLNGSPNSVIFVHDKEILTKIKKLDNAD